jgi:NAD(P)-dependent dehydrogenase (short-subunit alcohol dehydrogenase family)
MSSVWSYEGMRVVVSGGGGGGMGAAAVEELVSLGAEVHVLDLKEPPVAVASHQVVDLRDPDSTSAAVEKIGGRIDSLFNCAGLPGPPFSDVDTMLVNFVGMRHLAEEVIGHMPEGGAIASISSTAGGGWMGNIAKWMPLVTSEGFAAGRAWCEANPDAIAGGYGPSKEAIIIWTLWRSFELAKQKIRINVISPGPTETPMMPSFEQMAGKDFMDNYPIPLERRSTPAEQAYPLIFLNSKAASFITGENLNTDGGTTGAIMTGGIDMGAYVAARLGAR